MKPHSRETVDAVFALYGHVSAEDAARQFGFCSRQVVIGLWKRERDRRGVAAMPRDVRPAGAKVKPPKFAPAAREPAREARLPASKITPASPPVLIVPTIPKPAPVLGLPDAVLSLRRGQCKWPMGDPRDDGFRFCCAPAEFNGDLIRPYCAEHRELATSRRGFVAEAA